MKGKNFLMILVGLLAMLLLVGINPAYPGKARGVTDDNIKIAFITDLTGVTATFYRPVTDAFRNYFKYVNDEGGINGRKVFVELFIYGDLVLIITKEVSTIGC